MSFEDGQAETVPVGKGLDAVYLSLRGAGDHLRVRAETPDLALCVDKVFVGVLEPAD